MKIFFTVIVCFLFTACASEARFKEMADSWTGKSEQILYQYMGVPDRTAESGEIKYVEYKKNVKKYMPGIAPSYSTTYIGNTAYTTQTAGSAPSYWDAHCQITFTIENGIITGHSYRGNDCVE